MDSKWFDISQIESFLYEVVKGKVTNNIFYTTTPPTIDQNLKDFVVIDTGNAITDYNAYGYGSILIYLYAKPYIAGQKNIADLAVLRQKLDAAVKATSNAHYALIPRAQWADYDANIKWHCNIIQYRLLIA